MVCICTWAAVRNKTFRQRHWSCAQRIRQCALVPGPAQWHRLALRLLIRACCQSQVLCTLVPSLSDVLGRCSRPLEKPSFLAYLAFLHRRRRNGSKRGLRRAQTRSRGGVHVLLGKRRHQKEHGEDALEGEKWKAFEETTDDDREEMNRRCRSDDSFIKRIHDSPSSYTKLGSLLWY